MTEPNSNPAPTAHPDPPPHPAPDFTTASQPSYARTLFFGSEGLRPGWGLLFFAVLFLIFRWIATQTFSLLPLSNLNDLWTNLLNESATFLSAAAPAVILARIEHRPWKSFGLPLRHAFGKLFWTGSLWGFLGITLLLALMHGLHLFDFGHLALHGIRIAKFAAFWGLMFLTVGLAEEFLFRGYSQFTLSRGIGFWPAALTLSTAFGAVHYFNPGETFIGLFGAALIGFFFCLTLRRTGTLWFAVGFHTAWDWGETFFYSTPDSGLVAPGHLLSSKFHGPAYLTGGSVGPEGSILCPLVVAILWLLFHQTHPAPKD